MNNRFRNCINNTIVGAIASAALGLMAFGTYATIWERFQPRISINNTRVLSVDPYRSTHNDLYYSPSGYILRVSDDSRPIDFHRSGYVPHSNDVVNVVARPRFSLNKRLDGLSIEPAKKPKNI